MAKHTRLPWKAYYASNGVLLGIGDKHAGGITDDQGGLWGYGKEKAANAEFIVRACNSHYDLLEALESACAAIHEHAPGLEYLADNWVEIINKAKGEAA